MLATALNVLVRRSVAPDSIVQGFHDAGLDVPFIHDDTVVNEPGTGLILWASSARTYGFDRFRTVLIHPALVLTVPQVDRAYSRAVAQAPAVVVGEVDGVAHAVLVLHAEGLVEVVPSAHVPYAPLGARSASESIRHLRQVVMRGLSLVEQGIAEDFKQLPWRDWQADFVDTSAGGLGFFTDPHLAKACLSAVDIHSQLRPVLAPRAVEPPELGDLLANLHAAASDVVTTATRESAEPIA